MNQNWNLVHLAQFTGMFVLIAGLLVLYFYLDVRSGITRLISLLAAITAGMALGLYDVLQAVDGVALKHAVDAWASSPAAEKAIRFASAESIRWLEWAVRSYQSYLLGLAFLLFGLVILWTARVPRPIGFLMSVSGLSYFMQGWILGTQGFAAENALPTLLGIASILVWGVWFFIFAWRTKESLQKQMVYAE